MTDRWRRQCGVVLAMLLLVATGCATDRQGSSESTSARPELVIGVGDDNSVSELPRANVATGFGDANAPVFETLVTMGSDYGVQPLLATSTEFRAPNTWRFHLRQGVTFHNGARFDANAVVDNVKRVWDSSLTALDPTKPDVATVVDDYTVDLTPSETNPRLPDQLVHPLFGLRAPGTYAGDGTTPEKTPTGTGPFRFESYSKADHLTVARYDSYWGPKAKTTKLTFRFVPDAGTRLLQLQSGELDAIYDFPRQQASASADDRTLTTVTSQPGGYDALLLNGKGVAPHELLDDLRIRQAVAYGIDKATIVQNVWKGSAEATNTVIPAALLGRDAEMVRGYPYDKAQAERLLTEAGWAAGPDGIRTKDGRRLELTLVVADPELQRPTPELVQAQLKEVGIDVKLEVPGNPRAYYDQLDQGQGDLFAEIGSQNDADPIFLESLFTVEAPAFAAYASHFGAGPEYDQLFLKAASSPEPDQARHLAAQAMQIAVDKAVVVVPIAAIDRIWGLRRNVRGFVPQPSVANQKWDGVYAVK
jgi:peptide/nickel transport system substrate-binding protein